MHTLFAHSFNHTYIYKYLAQEEHLHHGEHHGGGGGGQDPGLELGHVIKFMVMEFDSHGHGVRSSWPLTMALKTETAGNLEGHRDRDQKLFLVFNGMQNELEKDRFATLHSFLLILTHTHTQKLG